MKEEQLKNISKDEANKMLNLSEKKRWVEINNETANLYYLKKGNIEDVEPSGWWY